MLIGILTLMVFYTLYFARDVFMPILLFHAALTIDNTVFAWQQPTITRVSTNQPRTIGLGFETKF